MRIADSLKSDRHRSRGVRGRAGWLAHLTRFCLRHAPIEQVYAAMLGGAIDDLHALAAHVKTHVRIPLERRMTVRGLQDDILHCRMGYWRIVAAALDPIRFQCLGTPDQLLD